MGVFFLVKLPFKKTTAAQAAISNARLVCVGGGFGQFSTSRATSLAAVWPHGRENVFSMGSEGVAVASKLFSFGVPQGK